MKNLNLNQMEVLQGGGHCSAARFAKFMVDRGFGAYGVLWAYEAAMCSLYGDGDTFNP